MSQDLKNIEADEEEVVFSEMFDYNTAGSGVNSGFKAQNYSLNCYNSSSHQPHLFTKRP